jgi:hypothetical protein
MKQAVGMFHGFFFNRISDYGLKFPVLSILRALQ